jgi:thioredoxin reductase
VFLESNVRRILGTTALRRLRLTRGRHQTFQVAVQGVVIRIGFEPNTAFIHEQLDLDDPDT